MHAKVAAVGQNSAFAEFVSRAVDKAGGSTKLRWGVASNTIDQWKTGARVPKFGAFVRITRRMKPTDLADLARIVLGSGVRVTVPADQSSFPMSQLGHHMRFKAAQIIRSAVTISELSESVQIRHGRFSVDEFLASILESCHQIDQFRQSVELAVGRLREGKGTA